MTTLVMVLCLLGTDDCREKKLQFHQISPYQCAMRAQGQIADPKRQILRAGEYVKRYRCKRASQFAVRL